MKYLPCAVLALVLLLVAVLTTPEKPKAKFSLNDAEAVQTELVKQANGIILGLNQVCSEYHLHPIPFKDLPMTMSVDQNEYGIDSGPTFHLKAPFACEFVFLQENGFLTGFINDNLFHELFDLKSPYYDKPSGPHWSKDRVIEIGNAFRKVFADQIKIQLGDARVRFDEPKQNGKYHVGRWMIQWQRVDDNGHFFADDYVAMQLPEDYSPLSLAINQNTPYAAEKGKAMSQDEASAIVRAEISSDKFWTKIKSIFSAQPDDWTDPKPEPGSGYLQIVTPYHQKNMPGRLAWVFWLHVHTLYSNGHYYHYPVSFWVDAYSGKIIGGDVVGLDTPD